jgi:Zn-dependent alcohol dehydrogenase
MTVHAAVLRNPHRPLIIEEFELDEIRADEVRARMDS